MCRSPLLSLALLLPSAASAATLTVGPSGTYGTIGAALNNANDGDVIEVDSGDYAEVLTIDGIDIDIVAVNGPTNTSLSGAAAENMVSVVGGSNAAITGFEFVPNSPRAVFVGDASLVLTDVDIHGFDIRTFNATDDGSGVECAAGVLEVRDSLFQDNLADDGSALRLTGCDALIVNTTFVGGYTDDDGGAIRADDSSMIIQDSWFEGHTALGEGGVVYYTSTGSLEVVGTTFQGNVSDGLGGAIRVGGTQGSQPVDVTITDSDFIANASAGSLGGAIYHRGAGDLFLTGSRFIDNTAPSNGGAIRLFPDQALTAVIEGNRFTNNIAGDIGGGLAVAAQGGGGFSTVEVLNNTFTGNESARGGGMSVEAISNVLGQGNLFCGNQSYSSGGGLRVTNAGNGSLAFTNNVFIENDTGNVGGGLAVFDSPGGGAAGGGNPNQFWNNSFAGNGGYAGGNIYVDNVRADFGNNIIAFATSGGGLYSSQGVAGFLDYNLWFDNQPSDATGYLTAGDLGGNAVYADPAFVDYSQDGVCGNDLLTLDPASPAIDAGDPSLQDPDGSASDIGAFGGPDVDPNATLDNDGDGWPGVADCDDNDASVNPSAAEVCDGVDNNCDGEVDDALATGATDWFPDRDGDGFGDDGAMVTQCYAPAGWIAQGGDCDDGDDTVNPNAAEVCDQADNDCNGTVDDGLTTTYYGDGDGDGFGDAGDTVETCESQPAGTVTNADDCDDANAAVNPSAEEICDALDNDCDTEIDEGLVSTWYRDADSDGFGDDERSTEDCVQPSGYVVEGGDCDDSDPTINPGADDLASEGIDQDCDGKDGKPSADEALRPISGCACDSSTAPSSAGWLALAGALLLARRRR